MINRSALVLRVKQPFLDWLRSLPDPVRDDMSVAELNEERTVYLVPDWYDDAERDQLVREGYEDLFEQELAGWWTVESDWPQKRTFGEHEKAGADASYAAATAIGGVST